MILSPLVGTAVAATATTAFMKILANLPKALASSRSDSLIEFTKAARVEPIVIMDRSVATQPYAHDILLTANYMIAGYYLQAAAIECDVGSIKTLKLLDKLNNDRDPKNSAALLLNDILSSEAHPIGLPEIKRLPARASLEDLTLTTANGNEYDVQDTADFTEGGREFTKKLTENPNLSVGIMLELKLESQGHKATIPVNVRLNVAPVPTKTITDIVSLVVKPDTAKERYYEFKSGMLDIWDMAVCQDLIDKERSVMLNDQSGIYKEIMKRKRKGLWSTIFSLGTRPSVAKASNIMIISDQTAAQVEQVVGGKLSNPRVRAKLFQDTLLMLLFVVDTRFEMVTIYHRTIDQPTELPLKSIKSGSSKQPDVMEILKSYQQQQAPRF